MSSGKKTQLFKISSSAPKKNQNALGKNIMNSLINKLLLIVLITTITVTPIIVILKQMSKLQKEKRGTPK